MLIRHEERVAYYCDVKDCSQMEWGREGKQRPSGWALLTCKHDRLVIADLCERHRARWEAGLLPIARIMFSHGRVRLRAAA